MCWLFSGHIDGRQSGIFKYLLRSFLGWEFSTSTLYNPTLTVLYVSVICHAIGFLSALIVYTETNHTPLSAELPQLNVILTGSGGILTAGQNYTLTCEASGGGSMVYTYMWLRNGSVVSGQTSSAYSFSPLRGTDSGQYSCQVRIGSTIMNTSREVTITVMCELNVNDIIHLICIIIYCNPFQPHTLSI